MKIIQNLIVRFLSVKIADKISSETAKSMNSVREGFQKDLQTLFRGVCVCLILAFEIKEFMSFTQNIH